MKTTIHLLLAVVVCAMPLSVRAADGMIDVWLDVDVAAGIPNRDVDDALALIQAFHSPELRIRGVSAVYGNAPLEDGLPIANELAYRFGPANLEVDRGAAVADDLGERTEAVDAMAASLREGKMTILALGPLTNVGSLLMLHPELHARIDRIVIVAGRRPGQHFTYPNAGGYNVRDFNFENDPHSMQVLLESDIELVYAPWEVSSHLWITPDDINALRADGPTGKWIAEKAQGWIDMWLRRFRTPGFNPFDTLAIAYLTHPQYIVSFEAASWIESGPDDTRTGPGDAPQKPYLFVDPEREGGRRVIYCYYPKPQFQPILMERLQGN